MRKILALVFMAFGLVLFATAVLYGDARVALLLFIPIIYGGGILLLMGTLLFIIGFILLFFSPLLEENTGPEKSYGGVILIGPIPIVFGSDTNITKIMLYLGLALAIILLLVYLLWLY